MKNYLLKMKGFTRQNFIKKVSGGFTLVEIMVATSIFMMIMLVAMGALITSSAASKNAQALRSSMDNVNFAMESITRTLRTGTDFRCVVSGTPTYGGPVYTNCSAGGGAIVFTPANIPLGAHPRGSQDTAFYFKPGVSGGKGFAQRCTQASGTCTNLVSSDVDIQVLKFYVRGSSPIDNIQPSVSIIMKGVVKIKNVNTVFALQATASQRSSE